MKEKSIRVAQSRRLVGACTADAEGVRAGTLAARRTLKAKVKAIST